MNFDEIITRFGSETSVERAPMECAGLKRLLEDIEDGLVVQNLSMMVEHFQSRVGK